ncbi:sigma-54 interaction domain-containing protein [Sulfuricella sp.]|uniref:sigma-54 interaction domain-containing protein n=1 Tax=Sulfuricella sp. TaxID=2099377 RepID=UPI002D0964AE|nr:sigma 54-interacting transcriptional regulator [Sulfuricella sp.]HUX64583.1 sigma 54-interacting transcriptional regulator [Sulfuricella sp.]
MNDLSLDLQSLINIQENPFVLIDKDYRVVSANQAYCQVYGMSQGEIVGRLCHEISHHSAVPCHENGEVCPHQKVFATGEACQVLHIHYDNHNRAERVRLKGHPIRGRDGCLYLGEAIVPLGSSEDLDCDEMRMIGQSPAFLECADKLGRVAESEAPILLYGESGVGKELAAEFVHKHSGRSGRPYVAVNCAAIAESVFESEFFGHERGAFTGCVGRKQGLFELAHGGTLFLDEIGEIPLSMQPKLLRMLETGEFRRVGGTETLKADVRIISATNRNLLDRVDQGLFREDLYYRIAGIDVTLPSLRERRQDIPALADALLARISGTGKRPPRLGADAVTRLMGYDYPGNVRELRNVLQKAAALTGNGIIHARHIQFEGASGVKPQKAPQAKGRAEVAGGSLSIEAMEIRHIQDLLGRYQGHRRTVADILGISERTLYRKLNRYGLHSEQ